jgi:hypothetical protein
MNRLSVSSSSSRVSTPRYRGSVSSSLNPVFVEDPVVTKLNTKNYLKNERKLNSIDSIDDTSVIINKDYNNDGEKFDTNFG